MKIKNVNADTGHDAHNKTPDKMLKPDNGIFFKAKIF